MQEAPFRDRRVTVMGLGTHGGGVAAVNYLVAHGALVTVTDQATEAALAGSLEQFHEPQAIRFTLGEHCNADFLEADMVVVNPAVPFESRWVRYAQEHGAVITSEIEMLLTACPATVIGVTGSNGKSTTAAMIADCLRAAERKVYLGGNIGQSLLPLVDEMTPEEFVVLELSSFQLAWLSKDCLRPKIAVVTNFAPNHLDWHDSLEDYRVAKQRIADQRFTSDIILGTTDAAWTAWARTVAHVHQAIPPTVLPPLRLPGKHNRDNIALAVAVALRAGCPESVAVQAVAEFSGLPHRLEEWGEVAGVRFINDSQATTPESTIAAIHAVPGPLRLLVGGQGKGACFRSLAREIAARVESVACYGATGEILSELIAVEDANLSIQQFETLRQAAEWQWGQSSQGDCLLLSPACGSHDQFADYAERASAFRKLMNQFAGQSPDAKLV